MYKKYMAASVPRFLRQSRLNYLPTKCVIGSRLMKGDGGSNLYFDIIMLPVNEFTRMRSNVGLQHVIAPALKAGPTFNPGFVLADTKEVIVPEDETDPENYAKNYFLMLFGLLTPEKPSLSELQNNTFNFEKTPFMKSARECASRKH